jgi:SAM-dependent methyltransferase
MSALAYHLSELEIARSANDPRRTMPVLPDPFRSILDLGCGAGQTLIACDLGPEVLACGVDVDEEALKLGRQWSQQICFVRAQGDICLSVIAHSMW